MRCQAAEPLKLYDAKIWYFERPHGEEKVINRIFQSLYNELQDKTQTRRKYRFSETQTGAFYPQSQSAEAQLPRQGEVPLW